MKIWLKSEVFDFHKDQIKKLAIQHQGTILAFSSGKDGDSLKLVNLKIAENIDKTPQKIDFQQIQSQNSIRQSINVLQWSPNDEQLAIAYDKLTIYKYYGNGMLKKMKEYNDHELEITCMGYSPDSSRIVTGGMDRKIIINDIEKEQTIFKTTIEFKILGLVWDTFDKYLSVLQGDNNVVIWKTNNFQKQFTIDLNFPNDYKDAVHNSKKEDRKIDWSSDYRFILVPSLDDKVIPLVCALDRNKDFEIFAAFMGPFSSINCVKFNPNLYEYEGNIINIFALGDNDGNISIWGVGDNFVQKKPFSLFKSHKNGQELIEDIAWNPSGKVMIATTLKRYVFVAIFSDEIFGKKLSKEEQKQFLEGQYGGVRNVSQGRLFKVFRSNQNPELLEQQRQRQILEEKQKLLEEEQKQKNQNQEQKFIFTQQKTMIVGGKKKIIPSKQVIQSNSNQNNTDIQQQQQQQNFTSNHINQQQTNEVQQQSMNQPDKVIINDMEFIRKDKISNNQPNIQNQQQQQLQQQQFQQNNLQLNIINNNQQQQNQQQLIQQYQQQIIQLQKPNPCPDNFNFVINQNKILEITKLRIPLNQYQRNEIEEEIQEMKIQQKIICYTINQNIKEQMWSTILEGQILHLQRCETYLYFYTEENLLYVIDFNGRKYDLPFIALNISYLKVNSYGQICMINEKGKIIVQDIFNKKNIIEQDATQIILENLQILQKSKQQYLQLQMQQNKNQKQIQQQNQIINIKDPIEDLVFDNNSLIILTFKTGFTYFYSQDHNAWHKLDDSIFQLNMFNGLKQKPEMILQSNLTNKQNPAQNTNKFFELLMTDENDLIQIRNNDITLASKLEERILFIMKYTKDKQQAFQEQYLRYIKVLCDLKEINKIRQTILDLFINSTERSYIYAQNNLIDKKNLFYQIQSIAINYPYVQALFTELETLIQF